jgi:hypothetical protein
MTNSAEIYCARCGQHLPAHATLCPACRTPTPLTPERLVQMGVDINARVTWGEPVPEIREAWLKKGAPAEAVEEALRAAARERRAHFRKQGTWDLLKALGLFVLGGIGLWIVRVEASGEVFRLGGRSSILVAIAAFGAPIAGFFLGIRGLRRIYVGGEAEEAATDISHSD